MPERNRPAEALETLETAETRAPIARAEQRTFRQLQSDPSLSLRIAEEIAEAIDDGRLERGARLPVESDLAAEFGVSRVTVREALSCLRFVGYVESRQGSGTRVAQSYQRDAMRDRRRVKKADDIIEALEARLVLEPMVIGAAARDPAPAGLRTLKNMIEGMKMSLDSSKLHPHTDFQVHIALIRLCRNTYLAEQAEELLLTCNGPLWSSIQQSTWDDRATPAQWLEHHHSIAQAVWDRQPERSEQLARGHLLSVIRNTVARAPLSKAAKAYVDTICRRYEEPSAAPPK